MAMSDEAKAELAAAIKIAREDGLHVHKTYAQYMAKKDAPVDPPAPTDPPAPKDGDPPPPKEGPTDPPKKKGLWWGDRE
jgi:hypothetical protein